MIAGPGRDCAELVGGWGRGVGDGTPAIEAGTKGAGPGDPAVEEADWAHRDGGQGQF